MKKKLARYNKIVPPLKYTSSEKLCIDLFSKILHRTLEHAISGAIAYYFFSDLNTLQNLLYTDLFGEELLRMV